MSFFFVRLRRDLIGFQNADSSIALFDLINKWIE